MARERTRELGLNPEPYQWFLYWVGALLISSAVFHAGVLVVTGGSLEGDVSWRKPILFGEAFGLTAISVSWILSFLPRRPIAGWLLAGTLGVANSGEVLWVSMQQWRGVPSHFNNATAFDATAFGTGGVLILFTGLVILAVTVWSFTSLEADRGLAWAIRIGMSLLVLAQIFGLLMIQRGGNTFGPAGSMKVPHALALHAPQVLPALAWLLLSTTWGETRRARIVLACAVGYVTLVGVGAYQTFRGLATLDLGPAPATLLASGLTLVLGAYAVALVGFRRRAIPTA